MCYHCLFQVLEGKVEIEEDDKETEDADPNINRIGSELKVSDESCVGH